MCVGNYWLPVVTGGMETREGGGGGSSLDRRSEGTPGIPCDDIHAGGDSDGYKRLFC